jgi:hypothetical protein
MNEWDGKIIYMFVHSSAWVCVCVCVCGGKRIKRKPSLSSSSKFSIITPQLIKLQCEMNVCWISFFHCYLTTHLFIYDTHTLKFSLRWIKLMLTIMCMCACIYLDFKNLNLLFLCRSRNKWEILKTHLNSTLRCHYF